MIKVFDKYENWGAYHWIWALRNDSHWYNRMLKHNLKELPDSGSVLDVGCGDGLTCALLKDKGLEVVGFDSSKEAVDMARLLVKGVKIELAGVEDIKLDRHYDYFLAQNVIEHLKDIRPLVDLFNKFCDRFMIVSTDIPVKHLGKFEYHSYSFEELADLFKPSKPEKLYQFRKVYGVKISKQ